MCESVLMSELTGMCKYCACPTSNCTDFIHQGNPPSMTRSLCSRGSLHL